MTKRTLYTGLAWLMIFCLNGMLAACQSDEMEIQGTKSVTINLYTATLTPAKTRATEVGVETLNENVIRQVDLFLYPKDKATGEPAFFTTFTESNLKYTVADGSSAPKATLTVDLPLDAYYKLFPPGSGETACTAFVIANRLPEADNPLPDSKTIANLKANTVQTISRATSLSAPSPKFCHIPRLSADKRRPLAPRRRYSIRSV